MVARLAGSREVRNNSRAKDSVNVEMGKTMGADCFYEGQGRLDGALCAYNEDDKMPFSDNSVLISPNIIICLKI